MYPYNSPPPAVGPQGIGAPPVNPLAAALLQGGVPGQGQSGQSIGQSPLGGVNPYGPPPGQGGLPPPQGGGAAPGSIPLGAPTNQFGNPPVAPIARPTPALGAPVGGGASPGAPLAQPVPIGAPGLGASGGVARPFGFGGMRPPGY